jgi:hypothetical protein
MMRANRRDRACLRAFFTLLLGDDQPHLVNSLKRLEPAADYAIPLKIELIPSGVSTQP